MASQMDMMIEAVKKYAEEHYDEGGWDYVVECFSDAEIAAWLQEFAPQASTPEEAISEFRSLCALWDERRSEVEGTVF